MGVLTPFLVGTLVLLLLAVIAVLAWGFWGVVVESEHDVRNTVITVPVILALAYLIGKIVVSW